MKGILSRFAGRQAHPAIQFIKYAIAGALATVVDVAAFYAAAVMVLPALAPGDPVADLLGLEVLPIAEALRSSRYVWDKAIAFIFSNLTAYVINILWVFTPGRHGKIVEIALFYAVSGASFAAGTGLGALLIRLTALPTTYAYLANAAASIAINYVCRKYVVFKG
ncbi:MAG: GtrA family protein [Elusimicrobia bacterium]|nr:GtrA family protein [Elusimicrobiota bacterium]